MSWKEKEKWGLLDSGEFFQEGLQEVRRFLLSALKPRKYWMKMVKLLRSEIFLKQKLTMFTYLMPNIHKVSKQHTQEILLELEDCKITYLSQELYQHLKIAFHLSLFLHKLNRFWRSVLQLPIFNRMQKCWKV